MDINNDFQPIVRDSLSDQIAGRITRSIADGNFADGERLPSIAELARSFRVAKPTVREALRTIAAIGVVEMRHGLGVFVRNSVIDQR